MRSLRSQLIISHLVLVALMTVVMVAAVVNFLRLGNSIDRILRDNYLSVVAAQDMEEALERMDSAATFVLAGQSERARVQYARNKQVFERAYSVEAHNITEPGEQEIADDVGRRFAQYSAAVERLVLRGEVAPSDLRSYYFKTLEPAFLGTPGRPGLKQRVQDILVLNQNAMRARDADAKALARRASWLSIGMTLGAMVLAVVFAAATINAALVPLLALAQGAEEIGAGHLNRRIELHRSDEIGTLAVAFNDMAEKLREARRLEQRSLHRAQKMSDVALDSLYDPVLVADGGGNVLQLNQAAQELFGPVAKVVGMPVARVVPEERVVAAIERAIRDQQVSAGEDDNALVALRVGDSDRVYRLRATPMRDDADNTLLGAALVLEDITHLRELDRLKTEFISVASHELRTPVTSLQLSAQLLQEGAVGALTPEQLEVVAAQLEDLERLDATLRDLLDITRLELGVTPLRREPLAAAEVVAAACDAVAAQAGAGGVRLETRLPADLPVVEADRAQLGRVLVNLLNNALRHTPAGGHVIVTATEEEARLLLRVQDTGAGIPAEYLPHIFDRFVQVPGATRGGAGLGLAIAQTIVQAHGGDITVASEVGHGSSFTVALPLAGRAGSDRQPRLEPRELAQRSVSNGTHLSHGR